MKQLITQFIQRVLAWAAKRVVDRFNPTVIAITGSVGKSSTREAVFRVLNDQFGEEVRRTPGNLNNEIGLPLAILGYGRIPESWQWPVTLIDAVIRSYSLKKYPKYLILEMGVDKPGDIAYLASVAQPHYIILTSVQPAHIAGFSGVNAYRTEKLSLLPYLQPGGMILVNGDDPELDKLHGNLIKKVGIHNLDVDYRGEMSSITLAGMEYRISCPGYNISIHSKLLGVQMIYPALFAAAIANLFGISLLQVGKSLEKTKPIPGRMNLIEGARDVLIIDDTYNANPSSVKAALDFLAGIDYAKRKVAILGNMNELGVIEREAHQDVGAYAKDKVDVAIFIGQNAENLAAGFGRKDNVYVFSDRAEALKQIPDLIHEGDLVLVKASQNGNYLEEVVKKLMKNPSMAQKLLVRQGKGWIRKKR